MGAAPSAGSPGGRTARPQAKYGGPARAGPKKKAAPCGAALSVPRNSGSALAGLVFLLRLVDHVDPALAAHDLAIAVALLERAQRISDLHRPSPLRGAERLETCASLAGRDDHPALYRGRWWARQGSNL